MKKEGHIVIKGSVHQEAKTFIYIPTSEHLNIYSKY